METAAVIILAFMLDCLIGDPQNPVHPVRIIGYGISWGVRWFRACKITSRMTSFLLGLMLTLVIVGATFFSTWLLLRWLHGVHFGLAFACEVILCYFIIAPNALRLESMKVYQSIQSDDLAGARKNLSRIVGRDTQQLEYPGIVRATVETIAENFSDGVIAPLFYVVLGGVPLGMAYKAANTLDSMIGYRNDAFEYFGKFAARLDDVVNYVPARISALLMITATLITRNDTRRAIRIYWRDRRKHKSPNSAQTESVCAGALGLALGGGNYYHGKLVQKPVIGDDAFPPTSRHINDANRIMLTATVLAIVLLSLARLVVWRYAHV